MPTNEVVRILHGIFLTSQILFWVASGIRGNTLQAEKCDIRSWYNRVYSEGLFDNPLTTKQEKMRNAIQALLIHSKNNPNVKLVDCNILQVYENELKKGKVRNAESGSEQEMENPIDPFKEDHSLKLPTAEHSDTSSERVVDSDIGNPKNDVIVEDKLRNIESKMIEDDSEIDETELDDIEDSRGGDDIVDKENEKHIEYQKTETGLHLNDEISSNHQEFLTEKSSIMNLNNTQNESSGPADNNAHNSTRKDGKTCKRFTWKLQKHLTLKTSPTEKMGTMRFGGYRCVNPYVVSPSYCLLQMKKTTRMTNNATYHLGKRTEYPTENSLSLENEDRYTPTDMETEIENENNGNEVSLEEAEILANQKQNEKTQQVSVDELLSTDSIVHNHKDRYDNTGHASSSDEFSSFKTQEAVDFKRLQDIVSLKTEEYTKKIHFLELNIIKLENQMLMEKLNKENHSSTIARLENNILRFENELLRMKQSFHHMKIDNDEMKNTQRKYLELEHSSQSQTVQNHSQEQLLSEQNQTIIRLSEKLRNQSDVITKLKNRSEYMDDQNRMLYAMVMNQTALVSQIMTKVQSLTEQTLQQREAAREMKQQIEHGLEDVKILKNSQRNQQLDTTTTSSKHLDLEDVSNQLLQQLDDLVSDKRLESGENIKDISVSEQPKDSVDEIDEQLKHYLYYTSVTYSVKQQEWCKSRALCYKSFIIISDCVPYSFIVFAFCDMESETNINETRDQFESSSINFQSEEGKLLEETKDSNVQPPDPDDGTGVIKEELNRTDTDKDSENKEANNSNKRMRKVAEEMDMGQSPETVNDIEKTANNVAKEKENLKYEAKDSGEIDANKANDEILDEMMKELAVESMSEKATSDRNISPEDKRNQRHVGGADGKSKGPESTTNNSRNENNNGTNTEFPKRENNTTNVKKAEIPVKYGSNGQSDPKDCYDYYIKGNSRNGVYKVRPYGTNRLIQVYCEMKTGGWTLLQKRQDGSTNFYRDWEDYKDGFGGVYGEHWLGNSVIHRLTNQDHYTLKIEMIDWDKNVRFAEYSKFIVDDESEGFKLHIGGYNGDAGDGMNKHNNQKFSTRDVDNDQVVKEFGGSCAKRFHAAWWFYKCYQSNLNGKYYRNGKIEEKKYDGVTWKPWTGSNYSLKQVVMKIRPTSAGS